MKVLRHPIALLLALSLAACGEPQTADSGPARAERNAVVEAPAALPPPTGDAPGATLLKLVGPAGDAAIDRVRLAAEAAGIADVTIADAQSFRVMEGASQVATLVSGEGKGPDATSKGCFLGLVQGGAVRIVPTISSGNWEMVTCGEVQAIALLEPGETLRVGALYSASSHNGSGTEPVILDWDRARARFAINEPLSIRASLAGAGTIAELRAALL